jgi:hypothetical protein
MSRKRKILKYIDIDGPVMDGADVEKRSKSSQISPSGSNGQELIA